ncbi:MAG: RNA-binding protein [Verrucomicrobia bacterium]|nr:RNA-binding protein [Verrucomicrobiota bacterium]MCF7708572.1 RNA-binding protein [Verrucomicrobiota bacterium]
MNSPKLFVGNLPFKVKEDELNEYFSQAGDIDSIKVVLDKVTGKPRGFAFVEYLDVDAAEKAVSMFDQKDFQGRVLTVNEARPRTEHSGQGRGFGSRQHYRG